MTLKNVFDSKESSFDEDNVITPIDIAVSEEYDEYLKSRRSVLKREYSRLNNGFVKTNNIDAENILYNSCYSGTMIVKATKEEIERYAKLDIVELISLYLEEPVKPAMDNTLAQIGVYCEGGTGYTLPNGWVAYDGYGIKVGVLEASNENDAGGRYDSSNPHLRGNIRIQFVDNVREDGTTVPYVIDSHATVVTSIIAGRTQTVNSASYTGVVPFATVYQMAVAYQRDVLTGIIQLVDRGVTVINYSAGVNNGSTYTSIDKEVDRLVTELNVVFVTAAGNRGALDGNVISPAKALNVISVGNAKTQTLQAQLCESPYEMNFDSSYKEEGYLPNKPDIAAPGTVGYVENNGEVEMSWGTSLSAPIVTGVVAQMMQAKSILKGDPLKVKAALLHAAESSKILTTQNFSVGDELREKSGAGLVNAINAVTNSFGAKKISINSEPNIAVTTEEFYLYEGQKIRAVLVFDKRNDKVISSSGDCDDIDFYLETAETNSLVSYSRSSRNNVEIIDYTVANTGRYKFYIDPYRIVDIEKPPCAAIVYTIK